MKFHSKLGINLLQIGQKKYSLYRVKMRFNYIISLEIAAFHFKSHNKFESNRTTNTIKIGNFAPYLIK